MQKNLGKDALGAALPELGEVISDKASIKTVSKHTAKKTGESN